MYQTSEQFTAKVKESGRTSRAKVIIGDTEITSNLKITHASGSCGADSFSIGSVFSAYADIELQEDPGITIQGETVEVYFGLLLDDGTAEYAKKGTLTALKPEGDTQTVTFQAKDNIVMKCEGLYVSTLTFPATIQAVLDDIALQTGISYRLNGLNASGQITAKPEGYLYREVLGYMAGCMGGFVYCDADGVIVLSSFDAFGTTKVTPDLCWSEPTIGESQYTVGGITVVVSEATESEQTVTKIDEDGETYEDTEYVTVEGVSYTYGSGGIKVSNPFMTQELFDAIKEKVIAISFRPGTVEFLGDARLEPTDAVAVTNLAGETFTIPCMNIVQEFDGGLVTTISAPADTTLEGMDVKGPMQKDLERLTADVVVAKEMISKRITADDAYLKFATIEQLNVTNETVHIIQGDYAEFKTATAEEFAANTALIDALSAEKLDSNFANIDVEHVNSSDIKQLFVLSEFVDKSTVGEQTVFDLTGIRINANDIQTGTLTTERLNLKGEDGLYYALNVATLGDLYISGLTEEEQAQLQEHMHANTILAHSITSDQLTTENIQGTHGWINLAEGTFNYGGKLIYDDMDGDGTPELYISAEVTFDAEIGIRNYIKKSASLEEGIIIASLVSQQDLMCDTDVICI